MVSCLRIISRFLATGAYSGFSPIAPGTVGSFLALILYWFIPTIRVSIFSAIVLGLFFLGVWASSRTEEEFGEDASVIVIDEMVGMWIALFLIKKSLSLIIIGFLLYRLFDVIKPFPIRRSQRLPKGWGVMVDDLVAGIYTNLVLQVLSIL